MLLSNITTPAARILSSSSRSSSSSSSSAAAAGNKIWNVYLSGEIHSNWREVIANGIQKKDLPVNLTSPNTSHEDSDDCGKSCIIIYIYILLQLYIFRCAYSHTSISILFMCMLLNKRCTHFRDGRETSKLG